MTDFRTELDDTLRLILTGEASAAADCVHATFAPACKLNVAHPVNQLSGPEAVWADWINPLRQAMPGAMRRSDLVMGGQSVTHGGTWVASMSHLVGNFVEPLFGIQPHGKLVFLRLGEFYRLEDGQVTEGYVLADFLDLLRQTGRMPLPHLLGTEMLFPVPATQDGVPPQFPEESNGSRELVEAMLTDLRDYDPETFDSKGQTGPGGYWHENMLWYGPAGIGSNYTYDGFQRDHRAPFLTAFPDRVGGNHFARFGDGRYVASGGWPSMTMTHKGPYLGIAATDKPLTLRVMDFWRVADGQIMENWVYLDMVELFLQMGVDVIAQAREMA